MVSRERTERCARRRPGKASTMTIGERVDDQEPPGKCAIDQDGEIGMAS